MPKEYLSLFFH